MSGPGAARPPAPSWRVRLSAAGFSAIVTLTDLLPPRIRYGYVHRLTRKVWSRSLPSLPAISTTGRSGQDSVGTLPPPRVTCAIAADHLDVGGIGSVVEMLAAGLPSEGVRPIVICRGDGVRAQRLRDHGLGVVSVESVADAERALRAIDPDVIQLHSAPAFLEKAALASGRPLVPVMHNTEIHFSRARWRSFSALLAVSVRGIAVSETVREFHARHLPTALHHRMVVVGNGAPPQHVTGATGRVEARRLLSDVVGDQIGDAIVFSCLARYDAQKNIAGTVWSFLRATEVLAEDIHLVIAGDPSDWAEYHRAEALRRSHPHADRVHLLGNSNPGVVLAASDAFLLNSFFEGWAIAAMEALSAGLPLVISEVGGARELVATDPRRCVMVPNPSGPAEAVSDAAVAAARRRSRHQGNVAELTAAIERVCATVRQDRAAGHSSDPEQRDSSVEMVRGHASVILGAAPRAS